MRGGLAGAAAIVPWIRWAGASKWVISENHHILGIIIPTDELIFFRGVDHQPDEQCEGYNFLLVDDFELGFFRNYL